MTDDHSRKTAEFSRRLEEAESLQKGKRGEGPSDAGNKPLTSGAGLAFRAVSELVAAMVVGVALGLWIDDLLDSKPWFLLIMVVICFVAGVLNTWRVVSGYGSGVGYGPYRPPAEQLSSGEPPPKKDAQNSDSPQDLKTDDLKTDDLKTDDLKTDDLKTG